MSKNKLSIVLPAKNEARNLAKLIPRVMKYQPDAEIIVVNDGSTDDTESVVAQFESVRCITHPRSIGNGGAIKTGARAARSPTIVFMDADGQHKPEQIADLLALHEQGYDMVVGARSIRDQASWLRLVANKAFNRLASMMTGFKIEDLTSGFRLVNRQRFLSILYLLPNKFSYPTTSTIAFFRMGYFVGYVPIVTDTRGGKSHIRLLRDGLKFFIIILKIGSLYSPMRLFLPVSMTLFAFASSWYLYTYLSSERFTNMSMLLYVSSLLTFLIGVVSEQVSALHYRDTQRFESDKD